MMRMYLVFLLFAIGGTANAVLPPEQFKNLNLATDDDLNPLHGVPWAKGILENHAELMNYDEPLREFILQLFHRTGTFDPSNIKDSFASNATPNGIGILMGEMKKELCLNEETKGITGIKGICKRLSLLRNKEGRYNPLAYRVLSTLLRYKANTRQDYRAYYEGLHAVYPKGVRLPDNWDAWLEEKFLPRDADLPAPPDLKEHYAAYLFWVLKQTSIAPPLEHQGYSISKIGSFPDCGETSLRNFIKLILDKDGRYNLDVLRELGAGPELVAFFTKFNTRQSQQDKKPRESEENEARNAWSNLTGGHKEVRYVPVRNDLNAGADNMLTLLKILLPQLNELTNWAIVFAEIEKIRKKHGLGEFTLQENQLRNEFGELRFQVQGLGCLHFP